MRLELSYEDPLPAKLAGSNAALAAALRLTTPSALGAAVGNRGMRGRYVPAAHFHSRLRFSLFKLSFPHALMFLFAARFIQSHAVGGGAAAGRCGAAALAGTRFQAVFDTHPNPLTPNHIPSSLQ